MSIELMMPSNHLILCCLLLLLPSNFPSIRVFSNELALCIWCPMDWSFSISLSNECSGLISFKIDWFDVHLCQHHSSKPSVVQLSAFFMIQLSHLCVTTGKTIPLTRRTFVGKLMSTCIISSSVQFSRSVVSDSLRPCGLQHTRPPCPSPTPGVYSNSCPLSQ